MKDEQLRSLGLKVTLPRMKILQILEKKRDSHLSADDIFALLRSEGEEVGVATVYRVLTQFEEAGLVIRHNFEGGYSVYELNEGEHHDHIVCVKCGNVTEFVDDLIETRQEDIAKEKGFQLTDHSLVIYGICKNCQ